MKQQIGRTHMMDDHEQIVLLYTMAQQMNYIRESFTAFETFKEELGDVVKSIAETQNAVKQELFLLRMHAELSSAKNKTKATEEELISSQPEEAKQPPLKQSGSSPNPPQPSSSKNSSTTPPGRSEQQESIIVEILPQQKEMLEILFIGDSISANIDMHAVENATGKKIVTAKAYSSVHDTVSNAAKQAARFPESNFTDVIPAQLRKTQFDCVILQSGSVDISNLNTKQTSPEDIEYFRQQTVLSANNLFAAAANALSVQPTLKKVVIMKQIPRYDPLVSDPLSLKPALSQLFNNTLTELWMSSPLKGRIVIGIHNIECSGAIQEARYREFKTRRFDGIHLLGSSGRKSYTLSVLTILNNAGLTSSEYAFHQSCDQYKYQNRGTQARISTVAEHTRMLTDKGITTGVVIVHQIFKMLQTQKISQFLQKTGSTNFLERTQKTGERGVLSPLPH